MKNGNKKIVLVVMILIIILIAILVAGFTYLYLETDTFKGSKELFQKYFAQNGEMLNELSNSQAIAKNKELTSQDKYTSNTEITTKYSEGGEISNPFNELTIKFENQKYSNSSNYADLQLLFNDENTAEIEAIRDDDIYGIRFTDILKQFVSIKKGADLTGTGLNEDVVNAVINAIEESPNVSNELTTQKDKYQTILTDALNLATYTSQKNSIITLNGATIKANQYTATLESSQTKNLIVQVLEGLKTDDFILDKVDKSSSITGINKEQFVDSIDEIINNLEINQNISPIQISVYEHNEVLIRTIFTLGTNSITVENSKDNGQNTMKIIFSSLNSDQEDNIEIDISKTAINEQENYDIKLKLVNGNDEYEFSIQVMFNIASDSMESNITLGYTKNITEIQLNIVNKIDTTVSENKISEGSNVILTDLDAERKASTMNTIMTQVLPRFEAKIQDLTDKLQITQELDSIINNLNNNSTTGNEQNPGNTEDQLSQVEINRFNAKFEFYTGDSVTAETVKTLLNEVAGNLKSVELDQIEYTASSTSTEVLTRDVITVYIEKDSANQELADAILERIKDDKKYKVSIKYGESNGLIESVTIEELEK